MRDGKEKGADNLTGAQAAALFLKKEQANSESAPTAEQEVAEKSEGANPAAEEEPKGTSAETQPEAEASAEIQNTESETEEASDDLSQSTTLTPEQKAAFQKIVNRETVKRKALEAQLQGVQAQLADMQAAQTHSPQVAAPAIPDGSPLAKVEDIAGLQKLHADAKEAIRFAEDALERARDGEQLPEGWTKESLRQIRREAQAHLDDYIPARAAFLQQRHNADQKAFEKFPFLRDRTAPEYLTAQMLLRHHPELNNSPFKNTLLGAAVVGLQAMQEREQAASKAKEKPKAPTPKPASDQTAVSAGAASAPRAPATAQRQQLAKAESELKAKGNVSGSDAAKFLAQRELARTSR
ncbi:MAG TPA: hypothetical protein VEC57_00100 [Candidatus Limnocylindrales bacterium]|nr:hypothetical protein [Candidatus Limnocylindrales bacterium]